MGDLDPDPTFVPYTAVLRIRDVYPGSEFFPSRIGFFSIPDTGMKNMHKTCAIKKARKLSHFILIFNKKKSSFNSLRCSVVDPEEFILDL
jgi:hypothetical protein